MPGSDGGREFCYYALGDLTGSKFLGKKTWRGIELLIAQTRMEPGISCYVQPMNMYILYQKALPAILPPLYVDTQSNPKRIIAKNWYKKPPIKTPYVCRQFPYVLIIIDQSFSPLRSAWCIPH